MLAEKFMGAVSQEDSEADISEYFKSNFNNLTKLESQNSSDFREMEIINRLRHSTSIKNQNHDYEMEAILQTLKIQKAGKLTRENTIEVIPFRTEQSCDSQNLPKEKQPIPLMKKNRSHYTSIQLHKLKTGIVEEDQEIKSDSEHRSAYSQALHDDFELLQNATAMQRFQILIKTQGKKSDTKRNEAESTA